MIEAGDGHGHGVVVRWEVGIHLPISCKALSGASTPVMAEYSAALKKGYMPSAMFTIACRMRRRRARRDMGDMF